MGVYQISSARDRQAALTLTTVAWAYRVVSVQNPDICAVKAYFPDEGEIRVHQSQVKPCPVGFPAGVQGTDESGYCAKVGAAVSE